MGNMPFFWKSKFGITDHAKARRKNVSETTDGVVLTIVCLRLTNGHSREAFVHTLYIWANAPFRRGSGRSEWFLNISPLVGALAWSVDGLPVELYVLAIFTPFVWLDGLFWLLVFWVLDAAFWATLIFGAIFLFSEVL